MNTWKAVTLMLILTTAAHAQYKSPAADFFMHDRFHDAFLRDHYRFKEPKPLRIEYWNTRWLDSDKRAEDHADYLHLEGLFPVYNGEKVMIDIPFQYSYVPIWAESDNTTFGRNINVLEPCLRTRWLITHRLKSIIGWEYNLKGDGENFGKSVGRKIALLKAFFSYDLHTQLNLVAGVRLDRYYYDTDEEPDFLELSKRLYYQPAIMLNWHPVENLTVLLGIPGSGAHLAFGDVIRAEARVSIDKRAEVALNVIPHERISATLRFLNVPYMEVPVKARSSVEGEVMTERLCYNSKSVLFDIGWKLNPAALASLGFRYNPGGDVELKDRACEETIEELDGRSHFAIGATFTMDIEALLGIK